MRKPITMACSIALGAVVIGAVVLGANTATAGGVERTTESIGILFETGTYAELSFGSVAPKVSGVAVAITPGADSGDMAADYTQLSMGVKTALSPTLDFALIVDSPYGAHVSYPATGYFLQNSTAELTSMAITGVLRYTFPSHISLIGGLRYQTLSASASLPFLGYSVVGKSDSGVGYLVGVAYEKPEIALRVALTYNSSIRHTLATSETGFANSVTTVNTPQSLNLEVQSGVAKDTLVFGSVRWVDWSTFKIDPLNYPPATPLVSYAHDTITYTLGIGHRFNENWSGAVSVGYERQDGGFMSNLGPTDGKRSITLGATYTRDKVKISGGVSYVAIGSAQTQLGGAPFGQFARNHAIGAGMKIGYTF